MADIRACHLPQKLTTPFNQMYQMYGVELTMDLNWKHQIQRMTGNLRNKLEALCLLCFPTTDTEHLFALPSFPALPLPLL